MLEREREREKDSRLDKKTKRNLKTYFNVIVSIVVQIEDPQQLSIHGDFNVLWSSDSFCMSLSGVLFHLNVIELSVGRTRVKAKMTLIKMLEFDRSKGKSLGCRGDHQEKERKTTKLKRGARELKCLLEETIKLV
jgi:hypothetical protein